MVEHLIFAMQLSNNKLNVECFNPPEKIPVLKKIMMSSRPFPREFVNPVIGENLVSLIHNSLNEAIRNLTQEVEDYYKFFEENPDAVLTNPTFGDLDKIE
jgi:oxepin-CoA hydrolase/3-oxo-5,6-dehydrosuberyl-CoA semialdehyde dehydrogenase